MVMAGTNPTAIHTSEKMFLFPSRYEIRTSVRVKVLTVLSSVLTSYGHWYEVSLCAVVQVMSNATGGPWMQLIISSSAAWSALNYWYSLEEWRFLSEDFFWDHTKPNQRVVSWFSISNFQQIRFFSVQQFCVWFLFVRLCFHERKDVFVSKELRVR